MKKHLLLTTGIVVSNLLSAQMSTAKVKEMDKRIPASIANLTATKYPRASQESVVPSHNIKHNANNVNANDNKRVAAFTSTVIGTTYYDLQTNSSVADRIVVNADGSIAAAWTMETNGSDNTYPTRGTGYNYFNNVSSTWGPKPTAKVEPVRVGWGNIVNTRSGNELILSHGAAGYNFATRATKGSGSWTNSTTTLPNPTAGGTFWPRMISKGDTVYSIAITYPVGSGGQSYMGQDGALLFSRSKDGGATWDIVNQIPTGMTSTNVTGFGGDAYAITAKGNTVAIVAGDGTTDIILAKSTDAGATWTSKIVYKHPIPLWNTATTTSDMDNDNIPDTLEATDGSLAIALDKNSNAFVAFGRMRVLVTTPAAGGGYTYFPGFDGMYMWDESQPTIIGGKTITGNIVAAIEDLYGDNTISFPAAPSGSLPFGRWGSSLTSYPSMTFDASNVLYMSYSSIVDSLSSVVDPTKLVRHVYLVTSADGTAPLSDPCDIVGMPNDIAYEGMFASMAKRIDGNVHLIYQRDVAPGNGIPGTSGNANPDESLNSGNSNDIIYFKIPVAEIGACKVDVGIKQQNSVVSGYKFYPNPAATNGTLEITLNDNSKMDINVLNAVGQVVYSTNVDGVAGFNKVDLNLNNLSNGIYFYQVKAGNSKTITNKFVIAK
eukprot:TRINITY_DN66819_c0_g1_i1.p1 TRINITY_DN66819_c0_g1~~TRINITY_DN66819_c0_g1_i1.p1  ORF type:complete len:660 (+),score=56.91 TRINITY_DN66819_c0_g1_i1:34-2013(+)